MDTKAKMLAKSNEISSSQSMSFSRRRKILIVLFSGFLGAIVSFIFIYTSKRMSFETWSNFAGCFAFSLLALLFVVMWIENKRRRSE